MYKVYKVEPPQMYYHGMSLVVSNSAEEANTIIAGFKKSDTNNWDNSWGYCEVDESDAIESVLSERNGGIKMKKNYFLGVDSNNRCCVLTSLASLDVLMENKNDIDSSDFNYRATNWGGCDDIDRTCKLRNLHPTGRVLKLSKGITHKGVDYDCGHEYSWAFTFDRIIEVT